MKEPSIVIYPDPRLQKVAKVVDFDLTDSIQDVVKIMFNTMYKYNGIGLAAPQIGLDARIIVIDLGYKSESPYPLTIINPEILSQSGFVESTESCLSMPGIRDSVVRSRKISIKYQDETGSPQELLNVEGSLAVCIQHEIDHLNGQMFIDLLSPLKKNLYKKKLIKLKKKLQ